MKLKSLIKIALPLVIISVAVALLLSFVNSITKDKIAQNEEAKKNESISSIFEGMTSCSAAEFTKAESVGEIGYVYGENNEIIGYYAEIAPIGFKAEIKMIVGFNENKSIKKVVCLSSSETPGVGTKATLEDHLAKFTSLDSSTVKNADTISGATISSTAVKKGITAACEAINDIKEAE